MQVWLFIDVQAELIISLMLLRANSDPTELQRGPQRTKFNTNKSSYIQTHYSSVLHKILKWYFSRALIQYSANVHAATLGSHEQNALKPIKLFLKKMFAEEHVMVRRRLFQSQRHTSIWKYLSKGARVQHNDVYIPEANLEPGVGGSGGETGRERVDNNDNILQAKICRALGSRCAAATAPARNRHGTGTEPVVPPLEQRTS